MNRERWQQLLAAALALTVWQGAAMLVHAPILLPSPLRVADRLGALLVTLDFWSTVGFSLLRIAGGFLLALAAATVLGAALWSPGSPRFWLSLGVGGVLTVLSAAIWYLRRKTPTSS